MEMAERPPSSLERRRRGGDGEEREQAWGLGAAPRGQVEEEAPLRRGSPRRSGGVRHSGEEEMGGMRRSGMGGVRRSGEEEMDGRRAELSWQGVGRRAELTGVDKIFGSGLRISAGLLKQPTVNRHHCRFVLITGSDVVH